MKARRTGFTAVTAALALAALVAVIGAAQAAPPSPTKVYDASVRVTGGQVVVPDDETSAISATLRLTLTNRSKQTLGSANFDPPDGVTPTPPDDGPPANDFVTSQPGNWTAKWEEGVVKFRSASSAVALTKDGEVSADVPVTVAGCTDADWETQAKQSNDFSGQPGNAFQPGSLDLTPLGSFVVAPPIVTERGGQVIPALETGTTFPWTATAYDLCGDLKPTYSGAALSRIFLNDADFDPEGGQTLDWDDGVGTVTFTPTLTETGNKLIVTDTGTGVTESSDSFDVSDTLCVPGSDPCSWAQGKISAVSGSPPPAANLGIGFNGKLNFECNDTDEPLGDAVVNINPRGYADQAFTVSITYSKPLPNGPASQFVVCFSKDDDGSPGTWSTMPDCPASPPCVLEQKKTTGGELLIVLSLTQEDPWTGVG